MATTSKVGHRNVSGTGFTVRIVVGLILLALVVFRFITGFWAGVFVTAAVVMFMTAFTRTCPLTSAWHLWFSGGGGSPAPKRYTGGGPEPEKGGSHPSGKSAAGGSGEHSQGGERHAESSHGESTSGRGQGGEPSQGGEHGQGPNSHGHAYSEKGGQSGAESFSGSSKHQGDGDKDH